MRTRLTAVLASKTLRALVVIVKRMLIAYLMKRKSTVCILCYSVNLLHWTCSVKRRGFKEDWIMEWEMNREIKEASAESKLFESLFYR